MVGEGATMENDYASAMDMIDAVNNIVDDYATNMTLVGAEELGLDRRCGDLYISHDCIAVPKRRDNTLQYYGGAEYVDKDYRTEMGDWVFYFDEDERVRDHLDVFETRGEAAVEAE